MTLKNLFCTRVLSNGCAIFFGFLAAQRIWLQPLDSYICLVFVCLAALAFVRKEIAEAISFIVLALFAVVDNGAQVYHETPSVIRYVIYAFSLSLLVATSSFVVYLPNLYRFLALLFSVCLAGLFTFVSQSVVFDGLAAQRDVFVLGLLGLLCFRQVKCSYEPKIIFWGLLGYLFSEVLNGVLFFSVAKFAYLSFSSTKSLIIYPFVFAIVHRVHWSLVFSLAVATVYVLTLYNSRMIILSAMILFLLVLLRDAKIVRLVGLLVVIGLPVLLAGEAIAKYFDIDSLNWMQFRAVAAVTLIAESGSIVEALSALDPVRVAEHEMFLNRAWPSILFGSGLGSGLSDNANLLNFVHVTQSAFSATELQTSQYFNLHDFWIDFGLRFGLIPVAYVIYCVAIRETACRGNWLGVVYGVLLVNSTFATTGILLTIVLWRMRHETVENEFY